MKIKMLRNLAHKPDTPEADRRLEGREYDVSDREAAALIASGLAVERVPADDPPAAKPRPTKPGK